MMWCLSSAAEAVETGGRKILRQGNTSPHSTLDCRASDISAHYAYLVDDSLKLPIFFGSNVPPFPKEDEERNDAAMLLTSIMSIATEEVKERNLTHANSGNLTSPPIHNGAHNRMRAVSMDGSGDKDLEILPFTQPAYHETSPSPIMNISVHTASSPPTSPKPYCCNALPKAIVSPLTQQQLPPKKRLSPKISAAPKDFKTAPCRKIILHRKFSWRSFPEVKLLYFLTCFLSTYSTHILGWFFLPSTCFCLFLQLEAFLIANREEYLRHSTLNYTLQQKIFNNLLTKQLIEHANSHGYEFDPQFFSFVHIRDRIRCYFKSYVQCAKKHGLVIGYAAKKAGLITEEELARSASMNGRIILPAFAD